MTQRNNISRAGISKLILFYSFYIWSCLPCSLLRKRILCVFENEKDPYLASIVVISRITAFHYFSVYWRSRVYQLLWYIIISSIFRPSFVTNSSYLGSLAFKNTHSLGQFLPGLLAQRLFVISGAPFASGRDIWQLDQLVVKLFGCRAQAARSNK